MSAYQRKPIALTSALRQLIRQNAVASVSGLFYLVPACTSVIAFFMFGETLGPVQLAGLLLATLAVLMISGAKLPRRTRQ